MPRRYPSHRVIELSCQCLWGHRTVQRDDRLCLAEPAGGPDLVRLAAERSCLGRDSRGGIGRPISVLLDGERELGNLG